MFAHFKRRRQLVYSLSVAPRPPSAMYNAHSAKSLRFLAVVPLMSSRLTFPGSGPRECPLSPSAGVPPPVPTFVFYVSSIWSAFGGVDAPGGSNWPQADLRGIGFESVCNGGHDKAPIEAVVEQPFPAFFLILLARS